MKVVPPFHEKLTPNAFDFLQIVPALMTLNETEFRGHPPGTVQCVHFRSERDAEGVLQTVLTFHPAPPDLRDSADEIILPAKDVYGTYDFNAIKGMPGQ